MTTNTKAKQGECGKCSGRGVLNWTNNANGVCFSCKGTGKIAYASRTGVWTRAKLIESIQAWFTNPVMVTNWGDEAASVIADRICRSPLDVAERALAACPKHLPSEVSDEVIRLCSFWRALYEARGETLA